MFANSHFISAPNFITVTPSLQKKLIVSRRVLKENYLSLLRIGAEFIDLIDKEKISFQVTLTELNHVLETGGFSKGEQAYIRRMRHQGRNNVAAKRLREKKRIVELSEEESIRILQKEKQRLKSEKQKLSSEIEFYRQRLGQ